VVEHDRPAAAAARPGLPGHRRHVIQLLRSGHVVGTGLRERRRRHRDLVDLLGTPDAPAQPSRALQRQDGLRVLDHPTPTAYCLPGQQQRIVLSAGVLDRLGPQEIGAVLAHERAHLGARHDLVLELFTVLHRAVTTPTPRWALARAPH
jgi:hypothetical protein